ncbi:MAG: ATP-binding cassette domain-containing protein [Saccharospirillum sp.]|uniref:thiamine ABC transporter ATP-binding protein n=1 Tax=Saccharospirillum sp. TaxID=2033801 RepID=UPI0032981B4B
MLDVTNLSARLGDQTFHWQFQLNAGELMSIVGASGLGKSTLLNVLMGLQAPVQGELNWQGRSVMQVPVHERPFGILFQSHNLFDHLSVRLNLALGLSRSGRLTDEQQHQVEVAARRFELQSMLDRTPGQLSGGQQQRAALARVFLQRKPVLLLDEPFSSLDPALRQEGLDWVRDMQSELGCTVLLVTHHLEEMLPVTDRILLGLTGQQWLDLSVSEFRKKRQEGRFESLLGSIEGR